MKSRKGLQFSINIIVSLLVTLAIASVISYFLITGLEGSADAATCTGWLRGIASNLADMFGVDLC